MSRFMSDVSQRSRRLFGSRPNEFAREDSIDRRTTDGHQSKISQYDSNRGQLHPIRAATHISETAHDRRVQYQKNRAPCLFRSDETRITGIVQQLQSHHFH